MLADTIPRHPSKISMQGVNIEEVSNVTITAFLQLYFVTPTSHNVIQN